MPQQNEPIVIKKYANRRLYNTASSAYIVIADIIKMVEDEVDFVVLDAKSGEDLTRAILNQVIFEQESQGSGFMFPLEFQRQLIRLYSDNCSALLPDYLAQSLSYFNDQRDSMGQAMQEAMAHNTNAMMEFSRAMARQNLSYYQHSMDMFRAFTSMGGPSGAAGQGGEADPGAAAGSSAAARPSQAQPTAPQDQSVTPTRAPAQAAFTPDKASSESPKKPTTKKRATKPATANPSTANPSTAESKADAPISDDKSASDASDQDLDAIKAQLLALQKQINDLTS